MYAIKSGAEWLAGVAGARFVAPSKGLRAEFNTFLDALSALAEPGVCRMLCMRGLPVVDDLHVHNPVDTATLLSRLAHASESTLEALHDLLRRQQVDALMASLAAVVECAPIPRCRGVVPLPARGQVQHMGVGDDRGALVTTLCGEHHQDDAIVSSPAVSTCNGCQYVYRQGERVYEHVFAHATPDAVTGVPGGSVTLASACAAAEIQRVRAELAARIRVGVGTMRCAP